MNRLSLPAHPLVRHILAASLLVSLIAGLLPTGRASAQTPRDIASGRVIVVVEPGTDPATVADRTIRQGNGQVGRVFQTSVRGFSATLTPAQATALARDPAIRSITPDYPVTAAAQTLPTGVNRIDADRSPTAAIDGVDSAMNIDIAIIDSGISAHPDLNVAGGVDCTGRATPSYADDNGHGTHVAGTAAARDNGIGVVGVAPGARLWAIKVLNADGSGAYSNLICAADWVTRNAATIEVANMSISTATAVPASDCASDPFHGAICASVAAGITYVVAAGNSAADASTRAPAMFPEVITVSALDDRDGTPASDAFASFSNWGAAVDIAAPGVQILSTTNDGAYGTKSGTSMASPHVAGAVGLLIAERGRIGPAALRSAIIAGRDTVAMPGDPDGLTEGVLRAGPSVAVATPTATATATKTVTPNATATATVTPANATPTMTKAATATTFATTSATATTKAATATATKAATATTSATATPKATATQVATKLSVVRSYQSSGSTLATATYDRNTATAWYTTLTTAPSSAWFTQDLGGTKALGSVRWRFSATGYADRFTIQTSSDNLTWTTRATGGNAAAGTWQSASFTASARYVRFLFANPNRDTRLGYVSEVEVYPGAGSTTTRMTAADSTAVSDAAVPPPTRRSAPGRATVPVTATTTTSPAVTATVNGDGRATSDPVTVANTGGAGANCRVGPTVEAAVIVTLAEGTILEPAGVPGDGWQPVTCAGQPGFVSVLFLTAAPDISTAPTARGPGEPAVPTEGRLASTDVAPAPTATPVVTDATPVVTDLPTVAIDPAPVATATPATATPFPIAGVTGSANANPATTALDRDPATTWRAETGWVEPGVALTLDLGAVRPVGVVRWLTPLTGPTGGLALQVSEDGERWMTVGQPEWWEVDGQWRQWQVDVAARHVRFTFTNRDARTVLGGLAEVEVYAATAPLHTLVIDIPTPVPTVPAAVEPAATPVVPANDAPIPTAPPETPVSDEPRVPADPVATNAPEPAMGG
ncbi:MAG: S8 family serine peptidase [Chloroflexota bacterium]|nr:S8 family serine peptidase [Chloroflexota bacterium]